MNSKIFDLAIEDQKTPEEVLDKLIEREWQDRHVIWDREIQRWNTLPCPRGRCILLPGEANKV